MSGARIGSAINDNKNSSYLGQKVTVSGDRSVVSFGAYLNRGNGESCGYVRVFKYDGSSWSQK